MKSHPEKIVVRCPNWVGDLVMATPALDCLRSNFPNTELVGLTREYVRKVVEDGPWFDTIINCEDKNLRGFWELVKTIRHQKPDAAILFPNSFQSALSCWLGGVAEIYGYKRDGRSFMLTDGPRLKPEIVPMVDYYLGLCRAIGLGMPEKAKPSLYFSNQIRAEAERLLTGYNINPDDMVIGLNPGAKFGASKCWPAEYFARLAELFEEEWGARVLLFSGPGEEEIVAVITKASRANIAVLGSDRLDLALLKPLVKRCSLLVTNDTGPRFYAVAYDVPVAVIFGSTDPALTASNLEKTATLRRDLDCSPCHKKICPYDHDCMSLISPEEVFQESAKLLKAAGDQS
jgi:heptosyltransferase-2